MLRERVADADAADALRDAPLARVLLLAGAGRLFCTGMDLKAARTAHMGAAARTAATVGLFDALRALPLPLVALVHGGALGGGTVFLFLADYVLLTADAFVQFSEVKIGVLPAMISAFIVPKLGLALASHMMLSGRRYSAHELRELRAVAPVAHALRDLAELDAAARAFVDAHLLTSSSLAVAHMKRLLAYVATHEHADNCARAQRAFSDVFGSADMAYGLAAFAKKEKPDWTAHLRANLKANL